jgi:hypothetical protein
MVSWEKWWGVVEAASSAALDAVVRFTYVAGGVLDLSEAEMRACREGILKKALAVPSLLARTPLPARVGGVERGTGGEVSVFPHLCDMDAVEGPDQ